MTSRLTETDARSFGDERLAAMMHSAVNLLDLAEVSRLLAAGVPPDVWGIEDDYDLPLQAVARRSGPVAIAIAKALVEAGADIDYQSDCGCTALHRSVENHERCWDMASYLVSAGADVGIGDRDGLSPPERAACNGLDDAVVAMVDAGMSPLTRGSAGPLLWYCSWDRPGLVDVLLARGADPNEGCSYLRSTPLQRAADALDNGGDESTFMAIAQALMRAGGDPLAEDDMPACWRAYLHAQAEFAILEEAARGSSPQRPSHTARSL